MQNLRNLQVWQKAHQVALDVYGMTRSLPDSERFGITNQLRRAAYSVPANLAEGCGRQSDREFARCVHIAMGSASELEYFLLLARDLEYVQAHNYEALNEKVREIKRMLASLIARVNKDSRSGRRSRRMADS